MFECGINKSARYLGSSSGLIPLLAGFTKYGRVKGSSFRSTFWAPRHPCRPGDYGRRFALVGLPTAIAPSDPPVANMGRVPSGVKDALRRAAWHPVFRAPKTSLVQTWRPAIAARP